MFNKVSKVTDCRDPRSPSRKLCSLAHPSLMEGRKLTREASRLGSTSASLKLKGIDGDLHNQWSMWFNSRRTEEPYPGLTCYRFSFLEIESDPQFIVDGSTGVAWPSSARAVGCSLQWGNERNPCRMLNIHTGLSEFFSEGSGDDVRSAWPLCPGRHTCYNGADNGLPSRKAELIPSNGFSVGIGGCNSPP